MSKKKAKLKLVKSQTQDAVLYLSRERTLPTGKCVINAWQA